MTIDFSSALSSTASVAVQVHWDPIADATYNLHQPTKEQFDRAKARCPELMDMEWEQALELFNPKSAYPLKNYSTTDFQALLPLSTVNVDDVWDINLNEILR